MCYWKRVDYTLILASIKFDLKTTREIKTCKNSIQRSLNANIFPDIPTTKQWAIFFSTFINHGEYLKSEFLDSCFKYKSV